MDSLQDCKIRDTRSSTPQKDAVENGAHDRDGTERRYRGYDHHRDRRDQREADESHRAPASPGSVSVADDIRDAGNQKRRQLTPELLLSVERAVQDLCQKSDPERQPK